MPRYTRLKNEHVQPLDAVIPRARARDLLIDYLMKVTGWSRSSADHAAFEFDLLADEHDQRADDAFEAATNDANFELEVALSDAEEIRELMKQQASPSPAKELAADLKDAEKRIARYRTLIANAEARRAKRKEDYRKLLLKAANKIVSEEERM